MNATQRQNVPDVAELTPAVAPGKKLEFFTDFFFGDNIWFWVFVNTLYSGFGVCCYSTITACGGTATRNQTYLRNPGYTGDLQRIMAGTVLYLSLNIFPAEMKASFFQIHTVRREPAATRSPRSTQRADLIFFAARYSYFSWQSMCDFSSDLVPFLFWGSF